MVSILDPPISEKVAQMKARVRWQHPAITTRQIDQTRVVLQDDQPETAAFSFLVIGDSGSGPHTDHHPQRRIAEGMLPHLADCRFLLHTGDVVYQVGSSEQYPDNFIKPYREWLVGGHDPARIAYDQMIFRVPFLSVLGNHDYYNLPLAYGLLAQLTRPLKFLGFKLRPNVGLHGSDVGDAFARAFLHYLKAIPPEQLGEVLDQHYRAETDSGRCLSYRPGQFTRLPNRYYTFRYGGIDFFALDSSTFNAPSPLPQSRYGDRYRTLLLTQQQTIERQKQQVVEEAAHLRANDPHAQERLDDLQAKLEQIDEMLLDIQKQLSANSFMAVDVEQLVWLRDRLVQSWQNPAVRGRVLFFHHPPYVTEVTKARQGQTQAIRHHLRWVLDEVADILGDQRGSRSVVDLVLCGHAHCLEYLRTVETGHADAHTNWIVCGGSGLSLRRQHPDGPEIYETFPSDTEVLGDSRLVAKSQIYVGLTGHKTERRRPYSFVRIDVQPGDPPQFVVRPYISERYHQTWTEYTLDPLVL